MTLPVKLEVKLSRPSRSNPQAEVSFYDRSNRTDGPIKFKRISTFFREVEVTINREQEASDPEPYNTHSHPDRPNDLQEEELTIESAFAKSGIQITRSIGSSTIVASQQSGGDSWTKLELHEAMEKHWSGDFPVTPQWKMWIFLSNLPYEVPYLYAGLMFDANIEAEGGLDRQGTAIFTHHHIHSADGPYYSQDNHPAKEAAQRQLFFSFIHETGHAFNLAHPHDMDGGSLWEAPDWMPPVTSPTAGKDYTWMNYPWQETRSYDFSSFYDQFYFRFNDYEN
ncbi:MAG: hypothetical protein ACWGQW_25510, partial [bacterium]